MAGMTRARSTTAMPSRWRDRLQHVRGDQGQAALEHIGALAIVVVMIAAVVAAFTANAPLIGERTSYLICKVLTVGTGGCGDAPGSPESRQPTTPCVVGSRGDRISLGADIAFIKVGGNRVFAVQELSDGTYKVTQTSGGNVGVTAGVGASTSFTVADNRVGAGASAGISGGVTFQAGQEWIVDSREDVDRLTSAENWDRFDAVIEGANPILGGIATWGRDQLGIGEQFPAPQRIFVAAGASGEASAYAGAATAVAKGRVAASQLLGYSHVPDGNGEKTFYFESTYDGDAMAALAGGTDSAGTRLRGQAKVLTSITVDADGNIVRAERSALATGNSEGLTNVLFGGDASAVLSDNLGTGTQLDARLDVKTDADRDAVLALLASTGINPAGIGVDGDPGGVTDPMGDVFMDAVRDRGQLTRYDVVTDDSILFEGAGEVAAGAKLSLNGGYSTNSMTASNHQYWDGNGFANRTNC